MLNCFIKMRSPLGDPIFGFWPLWSQTPQIGYPFFIYWCIIVINKAHLFVSLFITIDVAFGTWGIALAQPHGPRLINFEYPGSRTPRDPFQDPSVVSEIGREGLPSLVDQTQIAIFGVFVERGVFILFSVQHLLEL